MRTARWPRAVHGLLPRDALGHARKRPGSALRAPPPLHHPAAGRGPRAPRPAALQTGARAAEGHEVVSLSAARLWAQVPEKPGALRVESVTDTLVIFGWDAPRDFGSTIDGYEVLSLSLVVSLSLSLSRCLSLAVSLSLSLSRSLTRTHTRVPTNTRTHTHTPLTRRGAGTGRVHRHVFPPHVLDDRQLRLPLPRHAHHPLLPQHRRSARRRAPGERPFNNTSHHSDCTSFNITATLHRCNSHHST